jgi:hypothetical protein
MGEACSTYGRYKTHTEFWSCKLNVRDHSEDARVDGRLISERILGKER